MILASTYLGFNRKINKVSIWYCKANKINERTFTNVKLYKAWPIKLIQSCIFFKVDRAQKQLVLNPRESEKPLLHRF